MDTSKSSSEISRAELLEIIRKHYSRSGQFLNSANELAVGLGFWKKMVDFFFVQKQENSESPSNENGNGFDDMLFFVKLEESLASKLQNLAISFSRQNRNPEHSKPYFVRRWQKNLDSVVGEDAADIDWIRTFFLNLICHTNFTLTMAVCSQKSMNEHRLSPFQRKPKIVTYKKVTKSVFASPNKIKVDVNQPKATGNVSSFPEINFSVDDYDSVFDEIVLTDPDHCLAVLLNATGGAGLPLSEAGAVSWPAGSADVSACQRPSAGAVALDLVSEGSSPTVTLFEGFVDYSAVRDHYIDRSRGGGVSFLFRNPSKVESLTMVGPLGLGLAQVAVSSVDDCTKSGSSKSELEAEMERLSLEDLETKIWFLRREVARLDRKSQQKSMYEWRESSQGETESRLEQLHKELKVAEDEQQLRHKGSAVGILQGQISQMFSDGKSVDRARRLKCCVVTLSLMWEDLVNNLLYKDLPAS